MKCPKCKGEMRKSRYGDVVVDSCDMCYGIWLDKEELVKISDSSENNLDKTVKEIRDLMNTENKTIDEQDIACPNCNKPMSKIQFQTKNETLVDKCVKCEGMWFDAGELVSLTEAVEEEKNKNNCCCKKFSIMPSMFMVLGIAAILVVLAIFIISRFK